MVKKITTLVAAGLLLSTAFSSAADLKIGTLATKLESGVTYHLVMEGANDTKYAYGFTGYNENTKLITQSVATVADETSEGVDPTAYLWNVSSASVIVDGAAKTGYTLTNVMTGKTLWFDAENKPELNTGNDGVANVIAFGDGIKKYDAEAEGTTFANREWIWVVSSTNANHAKYLKLVGDNMMSVNSECRVFNFYKASTDNVTAGKLNELYNSNGFNLELDQTKYEDVANIFAEQRIKAISVGSAVEVEEGYTYPAGTYFAVSTPAGAYEDLTDPADELAYLQACEFIVVSPTENVSDDSNEIKNGNGFVFTTVSGRDLNKYTVESTEADYDKRKAATGDEVSVNNAIFKVTKNLGSSSKYKIEVPKFRYEKPDGTYAERDDVGINIADKKYGSATYLCTQGTAGSIFSFIESNVVKGTEFLYEDGAPAIYNIQFVSGRRETSELDKFLYANAYADDLYAKGLVLTDTDLPEFQFIVTEVSGNNVTFTNRANNGVKFTAQLFDEGDNTYSLSVANASDETEFTILNVDETTNNIVADENTTKLNLKYVKLYTPESTDKFNGTLVSEGGSVVTLSFARDNAPSSNKLYATVAPTYTSNVLTGYAFDAPSYSVLDAAQLQLVRDENQKPVYRTLSYAYRVGSDDRATVKFVTKGDTVAYYTYKVQLIVEGEETGYFLKSPAANTTAAYTFVEGEDDGTPLIIKENVDGSIAIMQAFNAREGLCLADWKSGQVHELDYYITKKKKPSLRDYTEEMASYYIRTYLAAETPAVSWPAEDGYATLLSETGNYVSMNEERDGLVVKVDEEVFKLNAADTKALIPTFFISKYVNGSRYYMYNPSDSLNYYIAPGDYDKQYQVSEGKTKVIFKEAELNETADTLTTVSKGASVQVAEKANNKGVKAGLKNFKFQIVEDPFTGYYRIRNVGAAAGVNYLAAINGKLVVGYPAESAMLFEINETVSPTANDAIAAEAGVQVIGGQGVVTVQGAAGKVITVANILGQTIANQVAASDNVTIAAPAGVVVVAVDGEATKVVVK